MNNKLKAALHKCLIFFALFLACVGFLGSVGYLIMLKEWPLVFMDCILFGAALPTINDWCKELLS